jgi:hypothetical protein
MLIALRGSGDRVFKADRSLIDPTIKFKVDCLEIQKYLYVSQYDLLIDISRMRLTVFTLLTLIGRLTKN